MSAKQRHLKIEDYLGHIEEAASLASSYVKGMTQDIFKEDKKNTAGCYLQYTYNWRGGHSGNQRLSRLCR